MSRCCPTLGAARELPTQLAVFGRGSAVIILPSQRVDGKVALITGRGAGIGRALALGLAAAGPTWRPRRYPTGSFSPSRTRPTCGRSGDRPSMAALDVTDLDSITAAVAAVSEHFGRIDVLINNAGVNIVKPAMEITAEDWDLTHSVNLRGVFFCSQAVGRVMIEQGRGKIINVASQFGVVGYRGRAAYSATKAGMVNLTRTLAVEWAAHHITVNAIAPTYTATVHNVDRDNPDFVRE